MKKRSQIAIIACFLALLFVLPVSTASQILCVESGSECDFPDLQAAVNATNSNDMGRVTNEIYNETVPLTKKVTFGDADTGRTLSVDFTALAPSMVGAPAGSEAAIHDIEIAPVNPEFIAYIEAQKAKTSKIDPLLMAAAPSSVPVGVGLFPFENGLIPAPATLVWPEDSGAKGLVASAYEPPLEGYFNLLDEGRVTPVKDQGNCGSCWAFASLGSLESSLLTDSRVEWDFSENNLKNTHGFDHPHDKGGNPSMSMAYLARWSGPVNESADPYNASSGISPEGLSPAFHVQNVTFLPPRSDSLDNDLIKSFIKNEGALYTNFYVNVSCFTPRAVNYYMPDSTCKIDGGHAVLLVGWNDSYPAENFNNTPFNNTPPGDGAFILKNSWGTGVGEDGFFYISYYDWSIGSSKRSCVLFTGEPLENYDSEYSYDPLGHTSSIGVGPQTPICGANFFTSEGYENLEAVSFYTREPGVEYQINIISESEAALVKNGIMPLPGYHTLPLNRQFSLSPNETFRVILTVSSPTDRLPLIIEKPLENCSSKATASPGESYVSTDGQNWADLTSIAPNSNFCIKAFTRQQLLVPENYATIQEAVDAARSGETVTVGPGTYTESVVVDKPLVLQGEGLPRVVGLGGEDVFTLSSEGITLRGFEITEGGNGVSVTGNRTCLEALSIYHCWGHGVDIKDVSTTSIRDVDVKHVRFHGFKISGTSGLELINSTSTENRRNGFSISNLGYFLIQNCTATQNSGNGFEISNVADGEIMGNSMTDNAANFYYYPYNGNPSSGTLNENVSICENNTVDGKPVYVWDGHENETVPVDAGVVFLINCRNITAEGLSLSGNEMGMAVLNSTVITVRNVNSTGNNVGIASFGSEALRISDSELRGNTLFGFSCTGDKNITVSSSVIADNSFGAMLSNMESSEIVLWRNSFLNNTVRHLDMSDQVSLNSSEMLSYRYHDAYFRHSLGNYWDDYTGTDADGDGIGDTSYNITTFSDSSPLMEPYENYPIFEAQMPAPTLSLSKSTGFAPFSAGIKVSSSISPDFWNLSLGDGRWINGTSSDSINGTVTYTQAGAYTLRLNTSVDGFFNESNETILVESGRSDSHAPHYIPTSSGAGVQAVEAGQQRVAAGQETHINLNGANSGVLGVSFTSVKYSGIVVAQVEVLDEKAALSAIKAELGAVGPDGGAVEPEGSGAGKEAEAPGAAKALEGIILQYMNIKVGNQRFENSGNLNGGLITFKVPKSWIKEEMIDESTITLNRFHDGVWNILLSEKTGEDEEFVYFKAETPGFSLYSITGDEIKSGLTENESRAVKPPSAKGPEEKQDMPEKAPGFGVLLTGSGLLLSRVVRKN